MQIVIVYDNYIYDRAFRPGSGFACAVRTGAGVLLFDAGGHVSTLSFNLEKAGIAPESIRAIAVSHLDSDHYGGLLGLLEKTAAPEVYVPAVFPWRYKEKIQARGGLVHEITAPQEILPGVFSTGQVGGGIKEQGLVVETTRGGVLIVGCGHPGIGEMGRIARELVPKPLYLAVGGFHLGGLENEQLRELAARLRSLGVTDVAPSHCSSDGGAAFLRREFGNGFIDSGVGKTIDLG
ncbi:MAG: MBL fold metallo-hydrolase [Chloroflexi bacterium]|nr:MBL fold metallo-hydrolase [Chloroflexota bacterium]